MKNKIITIYELLGLIREGKAPKKIKDKYNIYKLNVEKEDYENIHTSVFLYCKFENCQNTKDFLNDTVEILPEENNELEDIEELKNYPYIVSQDDVINTINQIIKNQKYLKEKLEEK